MQFDNNLILQLNKMKQQLQQIESDLCAEEVLADQKMSIRLEKQKKILKPVVDKFDLLLELENKFLLQDNQIDISHYNEKLENIKNEIIFLLASQNTEVQNANIEIKSIKQPNKLCGEILELYKEFCEKENFLFVIETSQKANNFIDNITIKTTGENAFDIFKFENGVHKCDRQEVMVTVYPTPKIEMPTFGDNDISISVFHSNGAGGQNVNNVATAIRIKHLKTGIVTTCQDERSQFQNKERALENLKEKVYKKYQQDFEKIIIAERKKYVSKNIVKIYDKNENLMIDFETKNKFQLSAIGLSQMLKYKLIRR